MKIRNLFYILAAAAMFTVVSCKDNKEPEPTPTPEASITVAPSSVSVTAAGETKSLTVKATGDWTVKSSESWAKVSPEKGSKDGSVSVTVEANIGAAGQAAAAREATVSFAMGDKKVDVKVSQSEEAIVFVVSGDTAEIPAAGGKVNVSVEYNDSYKTESIPEWITPATKATATDALVYDVAANDKQEARQGDIVFKSTTGKTGKVTVKQAAAEAPQPSTKSLKTAQDLLDFAAAAIKCSAEGATAADTLAYNEFDPDGDGIFKLEADIDFKDVTWVPFNFFGVFDGQNHRIYNIVCTNQAGNAGFISIVRPGSTVKNVVFGSKDYDFASKKGTYDGVSKFTVDYNGTETSYFYSAPLAYVHTDSFVENVVNFSTVTTSEAFKNNTRIGGVMGTMKARVTAKDCVNYGDVIIPAITSATATPGGVSGFMDGAGSIMENCINYGKVITYAPGSLYMGGITASPNKYDGQMKNCSNYGDLFYYAVPAKQSYFGGVVGYAKAEDGSQFSMIDCHNYGKVNVVTPEPIGFNMLVGGIIGSAEQIAGEIKGCTNEGEVNYTPAKGHSAGEPMVGGIVGRQVTKPVAFTDCANKGKVFVSTDAANISAGGVIGRSHQATVLTNCVNEGEVAVSGKYTTAAYIGGFCGYNQSANYQMVKCVNKGSVKDNAEAPLNCAGSLIGYNKSASAVMLLTECDALGSVLNAQSADKAYAGGMIGYFDNGETAIQIVDKGSVDCAIEAAIAATSANSANIAENAGLVAGGIAVQTAGTVIFGSVSDPIKVKGSVKVGSNSVTVTDDELSVATSYMNFLTGNGTKNSVAGGNENQVINAMHADSVPPAPSTLEIKDAAEFVAFLSDATKTADGLLTAKLTADIDLSGVELPAIEGIACVFDGQGHSLKNWTNNGEYLFGQLSGTVKNLVIDKSCVITLKANGNTAMLVSTNLGLIDGVINNADITMSDETSDTRHTGGLVAINRTTVQNCVNNGKTTITAPKNAAKQIRYGSIVGSNAESSSVPVVKNCVNNGDIEIIQKAEANTGAKYIGGVIGAQDSNNESVVDGCVNKGKVSFTAEVEGSKAVYLGGIIGLLKGGNVKNCSNTGEIANIAAGENITAGGLVGNCIADGKKVDPVVSLTEGCVVNCKVSGPAEGSGLVLGSKSKTKGCQLGSEASPVKVAGSVNGVEANAENAAALAVGTSFVPDEINWIKVVFNGTAPATDPDIPGVGYNDPGLTL